MMTMMTMMTMAVGACDERAAGQQPQAQQARAQLEK
jgi:hypothetical protein